MQDVLETPESSWNVELRNGPRIEMTNLFSGYTAWLADERLQLHGLLPGRFPTKVSLGLSFSSRKAKAIAAIMPRKFFATIAKDLLNHIPELIPRIKKAIDVNLSISKRALKD